MATHNREVAGSYPASATTVSLSLSVHRARTDRRSRLESQLKSQHRDCRGEYCCGEEDHDCERSHDQFHWVVSYDCRDAE